MARLPVWQKLGLSAAMSVVLFGTWFSLTNAEGSPPSPTPPNEDVAVTTRAAAPHATVGEWQGKLAVFKNGNETPVAVYDVFIASLPPAEQQALLAGITVYSETELQGLLEDYTA